MTTHPTAFISYSWDDDTHFDVSAPDVMERRTNVMTGAKQRKVMREVWGIVLTKLHGN